MGGGVCVLKVIYQNLYDKKTRCFIMKNNTRSILLQHPTLHAIDNGFMQCFHNYIYRSACFQL